MSSDEPQGEEMTTHIGVSERRVFMRFAIPVQLVFMTPEQALATAEALHKRACELIGIAIADAMGQGEGKHGAH